jgi:hypothetical protein
MKRNEFQKSEQNMADLNELLRTPVMRTAIEIVKSESVGLPDPIPGVDYEAQVAACGAYTAGAFRAFDKLESLCRPVVNPLSNPPSGQNQYDAAAKAKMREAGLYSDKEIAEIR